MDAAETAGALAALYATPPEQFVAARDDTVKALRAQGDAAAAARVAKLRRPTVGAWLVNLLVADAPDLPSEFAELAEQLREAQEHLAGPELRALGQQRHRLVAALVNRARELARSHGRKASADALGEVESTLRAALADADVAQRVLSGQLTHAESVEGFGRAAPSTAPGQKRDSQVGGAGKAAPQPTGSDNAPPQTAAQQRAAERQRAAELAKAERELQRAEKALEEAEENAAVAEREAVEAAELVSAAEQRATWLQTQLSQAEAELAQAEAAAERAKEKTLASDAALNQARERVEAAQARADLI